MYLIALHSTQQAAFSVVKTEQNNSRRPPLDDGRAFKQSREFQAFSVGPTPRHAKGPQQFYTKAQRRQTGRLMNFLEAPGTAADGEQSPRGSDNDAAEQWPDVAIVMRGTDVAVLGKSEA